MTNFQRVGAVSNAHVGRDFEALAANALAAAGFSVQRRFRAMVGVGTIKKEHEFDFGGSEPPVLVECKCHRWTIGGNSPSAKLTVWNEAMYYFATAPVGYRRILLVLKDFSQTKQQTLAEHYLSRFGHLIPEGVEIWELDEQGSHRVLHVGA